MTNKELDLAFDFVQYTNQNIFLTGKAGRGHCPAGKLERLFFAGTDASKIPKSFILERLCSFVFTQKAIRWMAFKLFSDFFNKIAMNAKVFGKLGMESSHQNMVVGR